MTSSVIDDRDIEIRRLQWRDRWEIRSCLVGTDGAGQVMLQAELYRDGRPMCRIVQAPLSEDPWRSANALQSQAIDWIEDWEAREHSGDTGFQDL